MNNKFKKGIVLFILLSIFLAPVSPIFENREGNLVAGVEINQTRAFGEDCLLSSLTIATEDGSPAKIGSTILVTATSTSCMDKTVQIDVYEEDVGWLDFLDGENRNSTINDNLVTSSKIKFDGTVVSFTFKANSAHCEVTPDGPDCELYAVQNTSDVVTSDAATRSSSLEYELNGSNPVNETPNVTVTQGLEIIDFACGITGFSIKGCLANFSYTIFELSASIARVMASFLDFFIYYSTNSSSYTNEFINKSFAAVRDIANIFFIIALLFIAIKTILGLSTANNKKIIGTIVVVALLINFSLFATQIVIDATNILAKVFYNQIDSRDDKNKLTPDGDGGQKSISTGLINKFNPQRILLAEVPEEASAVEYYREGDRGGQFIFVTLLASFIVLYTGFIFLMVALLFVGRVVALWISMIFAPIAFASLTIPGLKIPGIGFKDWKDELLKNAFMAPAFIFFLFIIVMFAGFLDKIISYTNTDPDPMQKIMAVVIPFAILMILLMKAKEMAVKLSGEIGKAITGMVKTVGGVVGGAALGAAAFAGTGVVGTLASKAKGSERLQKAALEGKGLTGWAAKFAMRTADKGSKATFDVRNTAIGGALGKGMGMDFKSAKAIGLGVKEGGFQGRAEREAKKIEAESNIYKTKLTNEEIVRGVGNNGKAYLDKNGNPITTASNLNNFKQEQFRDTIGKNDLLSSLGYSTASRINKIAGGALQKEAIATYEKEHGKELEKGSDEYNKEREKIGTEARQALSKSKGGKTSTKEEFEEVEKKATEKFDNDHDERIKQKEIFVKKSTEEQLDKSAQFGKMVIGGGLAVGIGAATGGLIGMGTLTGGALGGGMALENQAKMTEAERLSRLSIE
ncbi:MAG: hypothetical protein WCX46_03870, partial [Candidatus Paceibacterota bacterium]